MTSATVTWHPRESFVRYVNSGEGTSTAAGATGDAPEVLPGTDAALTYSFHFPFAGGWCDPATGAARITFTGTCVPGLVAMTVLTRSSYFVTA